MTVKVFKIRHKETGLFTTKKYFGSGPTWLENSVCGSTQGRTFNRQGDATTVMGIIGESMLRKKYGAWVKIPKELQNVEASKETAREKFEIVQYKFQDDSWETI